MKPVTKYSDNEIIHLKHCLADLNVIEEKVVSPRMSWQDVRSILPPMRRLLLDGGGELQRCWRLTRGTRTPFQIQAKELPKCVWRDNILVSCGNVSTERLGTMDEYGATIFASADFSDDEAHRLQWIIDHETKYQNFSIPEYLKSICLSIYGTLISRRNLLKYVSNKAGGVHVDTPPRNPKEKGFEAFRALDEFASKIWVNGKSLPYLEAQAAALYLTYSERTKELKKALNSEFKDSPEWTFV